MATNPPADLVLTPLNGEAQPISGWVVTFQLAVVVLFVPLVLAIERLHLYPRFVMQAGSGAVAVVAIIWLVERAFDLSLMTALPPLARML